MPCMKSRAHLLVTGRVQGVGYRAWARDQARLLTASGWVRNLRDGRVEAVLEGERPVLELLLERCRQGPALAQVVSIEATWGDPEGLWAFEIRATAEEPEPVSER